MRFLPLLFCGADLSEPIGRTLLINSLVFNIPQPFRSLWMVLIMSFAEWVSPQGLERKRDSTTACPA